MATIIEFRNTARTSAARSRILPQGCEIVLFPGVRYEYHAAVQEPAGAKPKRKSSRKRDKLELRD